jgi:hypothetical protein
MKIIKQGDISLTIPKQYGLYKCLHCKCEFEWEIKDGPPKKEEGQYNQTLYSVTCPCCTGKVYKAI